MASDEPRHHYDGEHVDVTWDERLCIHFGACIRAPGDVFVKDRRPWVDPDAADADRVVQIVASCPSGALDSVRTDGGADERPDARNTIGVAADGPLHARGELDIAGAPEDMRGVRMRATLCRCGYSANKPFCDNAHREHGFSDPGVVADEGTALGAEGGPLRIDPRLNGPLLVQGNLTLVDGSGTERWRGTKAALCRCGHSANKPFCDGSHKAAGFTTE